MRNLTPLFSHAEQAEHYTMPGRNVAPLRMLVVEDDLTTMKNIRLLLAEKIARVVMHAADTQDQAISCVRQAIAQGQEYDVVLLDSRVPVSPGEAPEEIHGLYSEIRKKMQDAVIIHTTAYLHEPSLMKMVLDEARLPPSEQRSVFISKGYINWPSELIDVVSAIDRRLQGEPAISIFQSCFISYSHQDEEFVQILYSRLKSEGLQLWYAAEQMKPGSKLYDEIRSAIQVYDKLLVVLSDASMRSEWVATEIRSAIDDEKRTGRRKLFPIRLVEFEAIRDWRHFNADIGKDIAVELREYYIPDFSAWRDTSSFEKGVQALLKALRKQDS